MENLSRSNGDYWIELVSAPHLNWKAAVVNIWQYRALAPCHVHHRSRLATLTRVTVRVESPSRQIKRASFPLHPLARVRHPSSIRDIKWFPTLRRTSVQRGASPLTTTSTYSQPRLSEPRKTRRLDNIPYSGMIYSFKCSSRPWQKEKFLTSTEGAITCSVPHRFWSTPV